MAVPQARVELMKRRDLLLTVATGISAGAARPLAAKVARTDLSSLVRKSHLIVVATVEELIKDCGVTLARAVPMRSLKGSAPQSLFFVAQPTWRCDVSKAVEGETVLLFLDAEKSRQVRVWDPSARKVVVSSGPLFSIAHSGRGRLVIESVEGELAAAVYTGGVERPAALPSLRPVRSSKCDTLQTVPLDKLARAIVAMVMSQGRATSR